MGLPVWAVQGMTCLDQRFGQRRALEVPRWPGVGGLKSSGVAYSKDVLVLRVYIYNKKYLSVGY